MSQSFVPNNNLDGQLPFSVRATPKSVLVDPLNWFMYFSIGAFFAFTLWFLTISVTWFTIVFFVGAVWLLFHYTHAVSTREINIDSQGVRYREASRKLFFAWDEIDTIKIEPFMGEYTFWVKGKATRMHEFGLPKEKRKAARELITVIARSKGIYLA